MNRVLVAQAAAGLAAFLRERAAEHDATPDRRRSATTAGATRDVFAHGLRRALRRRGAARDPPAPPAADARARLRGAPSRRRRRRHGDREPQPAERQRLQGVPRRRGRRRRRSSRPPTPRSRRTSSGSPTTATSRRCPARSATRSAPESVVDAYVAATAAVAPAPDGADGLRWVYTAMHGVGLGDAVAHPRGRGLPRTRAGRTAAAIPTARSRPSRSPTPRSRARWTSRSRRRAARTPTS